MQEYFHSVTLDETKCTGCTNCIKKCPTEAIRVRKGKARIIDERCIDCGECLRVCPYHAKKAISDSFETINSYKYKVVIPAPSLYGQFKNVTSRRLLLTAIKETGFDEIFEVAKAAEIVSDATRKLLTTGDSKKPLISSACPAVVRLIQLIFPNLIENLVKIESPMEVAAKLVKEKLNKDKNIPLGDIGVFFITPCAAKVTSVKAPYEKEKSYVDGVIRIKDMYLRILNQLPIVETMEQLDMASFKGIRWANAGGEGLALNTDEFLAVDGIHNVMKILEEIESDRLEGVEFIEALACTGGCIGGPLTMENVYVAKTILKKIVDEAKTNSGFEQKDVNFEESLSWQIDVIHKPVMKLDVDIEEAMKKLKELENINSNLPGLDCGACGAPSCRALAEDIVRGTGHETDCIFRLREQISKLVEQMVELEEKMPLAKNHYKDSPFVEGKRKKCKDNKK